MNKSPLFVNTSPLVTIIVPVYNVQKYLGKCIDSILNQTYAKINIILVNDSSPDDSLIICEEYYKRHSDIITIIDKKDNEGVDKARFSGLELSFVTNPDGYTMFVDSDDWLERDAIEILVKDALRTDADVVAMLAKTYYFPGITKKHKGYSKGLHLQPELYDKYFLSFFGVNILSTYMWGKLYKNSTLRRAHLSPSGYKMCEDHVFNMRLFPFIEKWSDIEYYGYNYRYGGMTSKFNPLWPALRDQNLIKRDFANTHGYLSKAKRFLDIELKNIFYSDLTQRQRFCNKEDFKEWLDNALEDNVWELTKDSSQIENNNDFILIYSKNHSDVIQRALEKDRQPTIKRIIKKIIAGLSKLV